MRLIKLIKRHRQSITLVAMAGILLVIAFYISQQTRSGDKRPGFSDTTYAEHNSSGDLPSCTGLTSLEEKLGCYAEAAQVSHEMVLSLVDKLVELEPDSARQFALIESQLAWEESRDAECEYLRRSADEIEDGILQELICLTDLNLARLERLEQYRNEWY